MSSDRLDSNHISVVVNNSKLKRKHTLQVLDLLAQTIIHVEI